MWAKKNIFFLTAILILVFNPASAQFYNFPSDISFSLITERQLSVKDSAVHAGVKPYIHFFSSQYAHVADSHRVFKSSGHKATINLIFNKHLVAIESKQQNFKLRLDPLVNFEGGRDLSDTSGRNLYSNTRGFIASGYIGKKFYFETLLAENQSFFPTYISNSAKATLVVPGQGRWKTFKLTGYDYAFSSGFISVQPLKNLNIQLGHGKQKIGNGYRSLLLSDNAFNYPYARITQQWFRGRVQYNNIYAVFMNLVPAAIVQNLGAERLFQKKAASFQYLSVNAAKFLNLGFFQGLIWEAGDSKNRQHLDLQYYNPLIYTNLLSYHLNNKNNIVAGGDFKLKLHNEFNIYGQIMLDDLKNTSKKGNGWGFQTGFNYFNVLGIINLFLQAEINYVAESSYLSPVGSVSDQSYSHYNQNIAYTPGSGKELMVTGDYKWRRFFMNVKYNLQVHEASYLKDNFTTNFYNAKIGYVVNSAYNLNISLGINYRMQNFYTFKGSNEQTNYIYFGLKTSLYNLYYDF